MLHPTEDKRTFKNTWFSCSHSPSMVQKVIPYSLDIPLQRSNSGPHCNYRSKSNLVTEQKILFIHGVFELKYISVYKLRRHPLTLFYLFK